MAEPAAEDVLLNKKKALTAPELDLLSKQELVLKVLQLQSHNAQLRNLLAKKCFQPEVRSRKERPFDFDRCRTQHIFLRVLYLGWDYQGFACQEDSSNTIEHHLMNALLKCKLIKNRETSNYHRCGRTDKSVSSFGQVISLTVRAANIQEPDLPYCRMLNRVLPSDIRAVAWRSADVGASSRFDCRSRTYRYFFPKSNLNLTAMEEAAKYLIGSHDFRNLCKMDVANGVTDFTRRIEFADISAVNSDDNGYQMCQLKIVGNAFLWHQVRCIVSILLLVGQRLEAPSIVKDLLDVDRNPRKPQYFLACPKPLNLFKCAFDTNDWNVDDDEIVKLIETMQSHWTELQIKSTHVRAMLEELEPLAGQKIFGHVSALLRKESRVYKPLLLRSKCQSLEERVDHYAKKRRTDCSSTAEIQKMEDG
ncbi:tRNA pseudouridine synthase [Nesidiocoris tenuis]|uniref:tRNA pseudouridine synthase n=1 Tax=Nesidiocoris tenuis TaxID=355587 RepID=A0ABN7BD46_9HEMI|nr:tRNA pseudouridine synthase [Nesidiocoris tenuis]